MFLKQLDSQQRVFFLDCAYALMHVDGEVSEPEKKMFSLFQQECGVENSSPVLRELTEILATDMLDMARRPAKIICFELFLLVMADERCDAEEYSFVMDVGQKLGIPAELVDNVSVVAFRWLKVRQDMVALLEGAETV